MLIARAIHRWWKSFTAGLMGQGALQGLSEGAYLKLCEVCIQRAKRSNTPLIEMILEPPSSTSWGKGRGYERELKIIVSSLRSAEISAWIKEQRKLRVLLCLPKDSSSETVQLTVAGRIRRALNHHLGPLAVYPTISFVVVNDGEKSSYVSSSYVSLFRWDTQGLPAAFFKTKRLADAESAKATIYAAPGQGSDVCTSRSYHYNHFRDNGRTSIRLAEASMEKRKMDLMADSVARIKYGMTPAEAVENKICVKCKQPADSFSAVVSLHCMMEYLESGLCVTCRNKTAEKPSFL